MARKNTTIVQADYGSMAQSIFRGLQGVRVARRLETRMARQMRAAIETELKAAIDRAAIDGGMPIRNRGGYNAIRFGGIRVFGAKFSALRAHIVGPAYMAAHNTGATITPKNGRYLAIPIYDGVKADGSPRRASPAQWRMSGSFIYRSRRTGGLYIARKTGGGTLSILYVLVETAKLKKHRGWADDLMQDVLPFILQAWGNIAFENLGINLVTEAYSEGVRGRSPTRGGPAASQSRSTSRSGRRRRR